MANFGNFRVAGTPYFMGPILPAPLQNQSKTAKPPFLDYDYLPAAPTGKTNARYQSPPFRSRTTFHKIRQQLSTQELPQASGHPRTVVRFADSPEDRFRLDWIRSIATGPESHGRRGHRNNGRRRHLVHDCFNAGCFS